MRTFEQLLNQLMLNKRKVRVAVVCPNDSSTQSAISRAEKSGLIEPILINNEDLHLAAQKAVELVRRGEADILMKGLINSDILLRAILNKETGILPRGTVLTQVAAAQFRAYHKLLFYTDAAVIPYPTQEQRMAQIQYITHLCHTMGIDNPKLSLIHCSEKIDTKNFPYTEGYSSIIEEAQEGRFGQCVIDGPLDLKTSCSKSSMMMKGISSPIAGDADALIFPDIEAANLFHKTITLFCNAITASILQGPLAPVVMPSRSDDADSKFFSLLLAIRALKNKL